jgi:hypothetical protein
MTAWNDFVKKIYHEGHNKDKSYSFKQALQDASKRKGEMGSSSSASSSKKSKKRVKNQRKAVKKGANAPRAAEHVSVVSIN